MKLNELVIFIDVPNSPIRNHQSNAAFLLLSYHHSILCRCQKKNRRFFFFKSQFFKHRAWNSLKQENESTLRKGRHLVPLLIIIYDTFFPFFLCQSGNKPLTCNSSYINDSFYVLIIFMFNFNVLIFYSFFLK